MTDFHIFGFPWSFHANLRITQQTKPRFLPNFSCSLFKYYSVFDFMQSALSTALEMNAIHKSNNGIR